jgi:hypothetical protein
MNNRTWCSLGLDYILCGLWSVSPGELNTSVYGSTDGYWRQTVWSSNLYQQHLHTRIIYASGSEYLPQLYASLLNI